MFKYVPGRKQLNFTHRFLGLMNGGFEKISEEIFLV